jgi:hypothetical protein
MFRTSATVSLKLAADSHIRRLRPLDLSIQREQSLVLNMSQDFIIELFCRIDEAMGEVRKHRQGNLGPSEVVTLGFLLAIKGCKSKPFIAN